MYTRAQLYSSLAHSPLIGTLASIEVVVARVFGLHTVAVNQTAAKTLNKPQQET